MPVYLMITCCFQISRFKPFYSRNVTIGNGFPHNFTLDIELTFDHPSVTMTLTMRFWALKYSGAQVHGETDKNLIIHYGFL